MSPLLDLVVPLRCAICGRGESVLCDGCRAELVPLVPPLCARCGSQTAWPVERCAECGGRRFAFRSARAAVAYTGPAPALVRAWKERGLRDLARVAADAFEQTVPPPISGVITYVPGDADRTRWRGGNTAAALAAELGSRWGLPVAPLLRRARRDRRQRGLSRLERRANVRGLFAPVSAVRGRVLLVDDVYTTGATANAAASALRRAGARSVDVVTFARAIREAR